MKIPVSRPDLKNLEVRFAKDAINSTWISSKGKYIDEVEKLIAVEANKKFALLTSNGTTALHLAIHSLSLNEGDEVIVPSFTFVATVNAVIYSGLKPVFADIDKDNWCLNLNEIIKKTTKKTKAIILVNLYGYPINLVEIRKFCDSNKIWLIEDSAESLFARNHRNDPNHGSDLVTYSFFGNKILTSGEGGAVCTSDEEVYKKLKLYRDQGMDSNRRYWFPVIGFNYRMNNVSAAILKAQFERKNEIINNRIKLYKKYDDVISNYKIFRTQHKSEHVFVSPWSYPLTFDTKKVAQAEIIEKFDLVGIETRPFFIPIHKMPPYIKYFDGKPLINTEEISRSGINLPTASNFKRKEIAYIISNLHKILGQYIASSY
jgi:perosamine synthetase